MKAGLNPLAADLLNPILSAQFSLKTLFWPSSSVAIRPSSSAPSASPWRFLHIRKPCAAFPVTKNRRFWTGIAAITPWHLKKFHDGVVARISTPISETFSALATVEGAGHTMAASGVVRAWFSRPDAASRWLQTCLKRGWKGVIEFAGENVDRGSLDPVARSRR